MIGAMRVLLAALACLVRSPAGFLAPDSKGYLLLADNLSLFSTTSLVYCLTRTPGYPVFLALARALFGSRPSAWAIPQSLLVVATVLVMVRGLEKLLPPRLRHGAWLAGGVAMLDVTSGVYALYALSETLFTFLLVSGVVLWGRGLQLDDCRRTLCGGALLGLALLTRPILLAFAPYAVLLHIMVKRIPWKRRAAHAVALAGTLSVVGGLWIANNLVRSGRVFYSTLDAEIVLHYRAAPTLALAEGVSIDSAREQLAAEAAGRATSVDPFERRRVELELGAEVIRRHPVEYVRVVLSGCARMLLGPRLRGLELGFPALLVFVLVHLGVVYATAIVGGLALCRSRLDCVIVPFLGTAAYLIAASAGGESYNRFRIPWFPLVCALSGVGLVALWRTRDRFVRGRSHPGGAGRMK